MWSVVTSIIFLVALGIERWARIPLTWLLFLMLCRRQTCPWILVAIATLVVDLTLMFPLGTSAVSVALWSVFLDFIPHRLWVRLLWTVCFFELLVGIYALLSGQIHWLMIASGIFAGILYGLWRSESTSLEIGNA